jgi:hypothetical protein
LKTSRCAANKRRNLLREAFSRRGFRLPPGGGVKAF